ncbi:hypothetical protein QWJ07_10920 [Frankia sp. RB7]|nr:hypothetical protein [Frankia sp. RB7]
MNLEEKLRTIMRQSENALTVSQVAVELSKQMEDEVRLALNAMVKNGELQSVHGGGGYQTYYHVPPLQRRL